MSTSQHEHHEDLVRAHFVRLLAQSPAHVATDAIHETARELAAPTIRSLRSPPAWERAEPRTIQQIRAHAMLHEVVRLLVNVVELRAPFLSAVPSNRGRGATFEQTDVTVAVFEDRSQTRIRTLHVAGDERVAELLRAVHGPGTLEVLGVPVPVPILSGGRVNDFMLHVFAARRAVSSLDLLMATPAERVQTRKLRGELKRAGRSPREYVVQRLIERVGIEGVGDAPEFRLALDFVVLQAFSLGRIRHAPGKLHGIIVGPPGQGKKLLALCAALINPVASEASAAKISAAGLTGANYATADGWRSQPGLIPRADRGVLILQDANAIARTEAARLGPLLQELMEDGVLRDAKAGGLRREVEVGVLIDANRVSQVFVGGKGNEAAILTLVPLLDRTDFLGELTSNRARAWSITRKLYEQQDVQLGPLRHEPWVRELQLLVGLMRDEHAVVDLAGVGEEMGQRHEQLATRIAGEIPEAVAVLDAPQRTSLSFSRLVAAATRANDSSRATSREVAIAAPMLESKIRCFARWTAARRPAAETVAPAMARAELYEEHRGKQVELDDVVASLARNGHTVSRRTVQRDFLALGARQSKKGKWVLPVLYADVAARSARESRK